MTPHRKMINHRALPISTSSLSFEPVNPACGKASEVLDAFLDATQENSAIAMLNSAGRICWKFEITQRHPVDDEQSIKS